MTDHRPATHSRGKIRPARQALIVAALIVSGCGRASATPTAAASLAEATPATVAAGSAPPASPVAPSTPSPSSSTPAPTPGLQNLVASILPFRLPFAVSRAVAFADRNSVLLAGGLTGSGTTASILQIDVPDARATAIGNLAQPVHDAGGAFLGGTPIVFGGGSLLPEATVQRAGPGPGTLVGLLPAPRADLAAVDLGGQAVVVGGGTPARLDRRVFSTTNGIHFNVVATLAVGARYPAVAAFDGVIFVVGGTDGSRDLADIQAVDPSTGAVRVIGRLPRGLSHASALVLGGHLLIAGGRSGGIAQSAIWELDPTTGRANVVGHLPAARSDAAAVVVGDVGYLIGGETNVPLNTIVSLRID